MLGNNLRNLRRERKMTQHELAKHLNVSTGTIAMWENGQRSPMLDTALELAKLFNVTVDWLLEGENNCVEVKLPKTENSVTILGRNGTFKTLLLSDSQIHSIESFAKTLEKDEI